MCSKCGFPLLLKFHAMSRQECSPAAKVKYKSCRISELPSHFDLNLDTANTHNDLLICIMYLSMCLQGGLTFGVKLTCHSGARVVLAAKHKYKPCLVLTLMMAILPSQFDLNLENTDTHGVHLMCVKYLSVFLKGGATLVAQSPCYIVGQECIPAAKFKFISCLVSAQSSDFGLESQHRYYSWIMTTM